jgi:hypothetical protein
MLKGASRERTAERPAERTIERKATVPKREDEKEKEKENRARKTDVTKVKTYTELKKSEELLLVDVKRMSTELQVERESNAALKAEQSVQTAALSKAQSKLSKAHAEIAQLTQRMAMLETRLQLEGIDPISMEMEKIESSEHAQQVLAALDALPHIHAQLKHSLAQLTQ